MIAAAGGNSIPCAPYATFGTRELSEHVALALKNSKATLLQHHGLIACEANLEKALWLAHEVEVLAQLYRDPGDPPSGNHPPRRWYLWCSDSPSLSALEDHLVIVVMDITERINGTYRFRMANLICNI